jgi:hypothetical protein
MSKTNDFRRIYGCQLFDNTSLKNNIKYYKLSCLTVFCLQRKLLENGFSISSFFCANLQKLDVEVAEVLTMASYNLYKSWSDG